MLNRLHVLSNHSLILPITFIPLILSLSGCYISPYYLKTESSISTKKNAVYYNLQLGLAYLEAGDLLKAREKLLAAEQQQPKEVDSLIGIAYLLEQTGADKNAETYYLKALQVDACNGAACNNYGRFLCERGQYAKAESYFLKAINNSRYANVERAYENAGLCAMRAADTRKAIDYLKAALKHNANLERCWLALSELHQLHEPLLAAQYLQQYRKIAKHPTLSSHTLQNRLAKQLHTKKENGDH